MKYLITILLLCSKAFATNYYIDNSGSDANNGLSAGTAWQTVAKVNSFSFSSGDSILFNSNGTWNEALVLKSSGSPGNPIVVSRYGIGNGPIITALQTLGGFVNTSGNLWSATATNSVPYLNTVVIGGILTAKGRYPNTGYLIFQSYSGKYQITSASITGSPDYTGGEAVVRDAHWILDVCKISSQSGGTLNFRDSMTYVPSVGGNGFFIQNIESALDLQNEWCFDSASKVLEIYSIGAPTTVQIATIDTLCYLNKSHVTIDGISFIGANKAAIQMDSLSHDTIRNCTFNYSFFGISGKKIDSSGIYNNSILNSLSNGIFLADPNSYRQTNNQCTHNYIGTNFIKNTALQAGMGLSYNGAYFALYGVGTNNTYWNNRIDSVGYIGAFFPGNNTLVKYNYVTNFNLIKDDGGGLYTTIGSVFPPYFDTGTVIRKNIVGNGIGDPRGTMGGSYSPPLYFDLAARGITADSNTLFNGLLNAVFYNAPSYINLYDNTVIDSLGAVMQVTSAGGSHFNIKRNIFYSQSSTQPVLLYGITPTSYGSIVENDNYFLRPVSESGKLKIAITNYDLPAWVTYTNLDSNSVSTPKNVTSSLPIIAINPTLSDSTIAFSGLYIDAKGVSYNNTAVIPPFGSLILFKATYEITNKKFRIGNLIFIQ